PEPGIPESFKVLLKELQSLCLNVEVLSSDGQAVSLGEGAEDDDLDRTAANLGINLSRDESSAADELAQQVGGRAAVTAVPLRTRRISVPPRRALHTAPTPIAGPAIIPPGKGRLSCRTSTTSTSWSSASRRPRTSVTGPMARSRSRRPSTTA